MIHLDTSFLIRALVRDSPHDHRLREWLEGGDTIGISSVGWAEFLCGPVEPNHVELAVRILSRRLPFEEEDAFLAAELFNRAGRRRGSFVDCMVAATAIRSGARLATADAGDFRRFEAAGLKTIVA